MRKFSTFLLLVMMVMSGCSAPDAIPLPPTATPTRPADWGVNVVQSTSTPVAISVPPEGDEDECENPFYPVSDEATWTYGISSGGSAVHVMSADDFGKFTINIQGDNSTFTVDGQCSEEGIILMDVPGASTTYSGEQGNSTVSTLEVSGVTLPKDVGQGEQWSQTITVTTEAGSSIIQTDYTAIGFENISVPAGDFYALKVEQSGYVTVFGQKVNMHGFQWFSEGVGTVKSAMDGAPSVELISYDIPE